MFQNAFQSGGYLEIFDAKINKEKDKNFDKLFKIINPNGVNKTFDKLTKGYIYELDDAMRTKMQFPKNDKQELALVQHYLVFQIFIPVGASFSLEIVVTDTTKNKRRLNFTTSVKTIDKTHFHAKIPVDSIKRGVWLNLSFDLISFFDLFKGQTFRSIDSFVLGAVCKIRKIFTMKNPLVDFSSDDEFQNQVSESHLVPKSVNFSAGVSYNNQLINLDLVQKQTMQSPDQKDYTGYDDSISKNSTDISQALKVRGLTSGLKEPKSSYSNNDTNSRLQARQDDKKGLKTQQIPPKAGNTLYSEQERKSPAREKEGVNGSLLVRGIPRKNNLLASYEIEGETPVNRSLENTNAKLINSPSKEDIEFESPQKIRSEQANQQRKAYSIDPKNRNLNSKNKKATLVDVDEEEKVSRLQERKNREISATKMKTKLEATKIQSDKVSEKRSPAKDEFKRYEDQSEISSDSQYAFSTAKKFVNDAKQTSHSDNPWGNGTKGLKNNTSRTNPQQASPKTTMYSPRIFGNGAKAGSSQTQSQKTKNVTKNNEKEESKFPKEFEKTGFSDSSERFNTTGRLSNQRYEVANNRGDFDFGPFQAVEEIESIEENLEYEIGSNASGMNGSRGFNDFREKKIDYNPDLITISNQKAYTKPNENSPLKTKNEAHNYPVGPKKRTYDDHQSSKVTRIDAIIGDKNDNYGDKIISDSNRGPLDNKNHLIKSNQEEKAKINNFNDQMSNIAGKLRPYSPPYSIGQNNTRQKGDDKDQPNEANLEGVKKVNLNTNSHEMLEVVYDSTWNCYYHPETNTYYELKE